VVTGPRRALAIGIALVGVYLLGSMVSGRLSPLARRPLLDGFAPPPPYRWVSPPPSLAATNQQPSRGTFDILLDPLTGSEAGVFSTDDGQASLALGQGAIATTGNDTSVTLEIVPLAPARGSTVPRGMELTGNVYRVTATYRPSGAPVERLQKPGQLVLAYPAPADGLTRRHTLIQSSDARVWTVVQGIDAIAQHLVQGNVTAPGQFAVGQSRVATRRSSVRTLVYRIILFGGLAAIVAAIAVAELRYRRKGPSRGRERPQPPRGSR
jgi:hypothetical protein